MNYKKELLNFMVGCLIGVPFFGYSHLLSELPPYLDQNTHNFLDEIIFFPCEFEEIPLDLKNHAIDFECHDNLFLVEELIGKSTRGESRDRFRRTHHSLSNYIHVADVKGRRISEINHSSTILSIRGQSHIESWARFFYDLESNIEFSKDTKAIFLGIFSKKPGQNVLLKLENRPHDNFF